MSIWEDLEEFTFQGTRKHNPIVASLSKKSLLYFGKKLTDAGFDLNAKYRIAFDRNARRVVLKPDKNGFPLMKNNKNRVLRLTRFCRHFEIKVPCTIESFERDGDVWILPLIESD